MYKELTESELAMLIGTRDGFTIARRLLQMIDTGEVDPSEAEGIDHAVQRISDEVLEESVRKYGSDTVFVEGDPYVVAASEALRESMSRGLRGVFSRNPSRRRSKRRRVAAEQP